MYKAGFIGCGHMGGTLAAVAAKALGGENILVSDHDAAKTAKLQDEWGCVPATVKDIAEGSKVIFLGVKPQNIQDALSEISHIITDRMANDNPDDDAMIVSMAAGVSIDSLAGILNTQAPWCPIIRIMPNTPAAVGEGIILYTPGDAVTENQEKAFLEMMAPAGKLVKIDEAEMDMGCAVTGCGPGFVYAFIKAIEDGAKKIGISEEKARDFAIQTVAGAAKLAAAGDEDLEVLKNNVCSEGGATIEGVKVLEKNNLHDSVVAAIEASYNRTVELGKK